jgi:hypothetical protein
MAMYLEINLLGDGELDALIMVSVPQKITFVHQHLAYALLF